MLTSYVVEPEFEKKGADFTKFGSKSDALEAFWRGLEGLGRSSGGVLEEVLGVLGGLGRVAGLRMPICKKLLGFGPQVGLHVGPEKCVF